MLEGAVSYTHLDVYKRQVDKYTYLEAMRASVADATSLRCLLHAALTDKVNDRETFMKGIDYSYYYEQES